MSNHMVPVPFRDKLAVVLLDLAKARHAAKLRDKQLKVLHLVATHDIASVNVSKFDNNSVDV